MTSLARALAARCDLLGIEAAPLAWLGIDVLLLLALAGGVVGRLERSREEGRWGPVRTLLASGLVLVATVVLSATLLGAARQLSWRKQLALHGLALALFVVAEWSCGRRIGPREVARWALRPLAALAASLRGLLSADGWRRARRGESLVLLALVAALLFYLVLALFTPPLNYDSNTYRLSRVALWLQAGHTYHFETNDPRQNWIGQNADLVMLWLSGFFRREYPLVKLAQYGGGLLACLAICQLAGWLGMTRRWRLGAALILIGMPTVGTQFISSQTDLFTAGCLAAGLAFLPAALRGPKRAEWVLVGVGFGLALGAKATVLYWIPGLVVLLAGWAWIERSPARAVVRGGVIAAAVAIPLCGFNFLLNSWELASPLAPRRDLSMQGNLLPNEPADQITFSALALVWQLFEPQSNPFVPPAVHEPAFAGLLEALAARSRGFRSLHDAGGDLSGGLNEDEASFGILIALVASLGGLAACLAAARGGAADRRRVAVLVVALAGFLAVYAWLGASTVNQFRYFCVQAPFTALVAADLFARRRALAGRALGSLVLLVQFATAIDVSLESRSQGLRVLRDPEAARWVAHWREARQVREALGKEPLDVGLVLTGDSWQAPLFRGEIPHRWFPLNAWELSDRPGVGKLLEARGLDVLVADPVAMHDLVGSDPSIRPSSVQLGLRRAIYRPVAGGGPAGSRVVAVEGAYSDRWTKLRVAFHLAQWRSGRFEVGVSNPTPLSRDVEVRSHREVRSYELAPHAAARLTVDVEAQDTVTLKIEPPFVPAALGVGPDLRSLGLLLDRTNVVLSEGLFGDRWTAPRASFQLVDWQLGTLELELDNRTPIARTVRATSSLQQVSWDLPPQSRRTMALAVEPQDRVELDVSPPYVPHLWGAGDDERELGVLLTGEPGDPAER